MARRDGEPVTRAAGPIAAAARAALETVLSRGAAAVMIRAELMLGGTIERCVPDLDCVRTGLDLAGEFEE